MKTGILIDTRCGGRRVRARERARSGVMDAE